MIKRNFLYVVEALRLLTIRYLASFLVVAIIGVFMYTMGSIVATVLSNS
jgi:hypothetical protein